MQTKIEKKVFYLQAYCLIITLLIGGLLVTGFGNAQKQKFAEIDVERINIVENNGYLLKPFAFEKFVTAMQKFETLKQTFVSAQKDFWREIQASFTEPKYKERFVVKVRGGIRLLETRQIAYIKTQNEIPFAFDAAGDKFSLKENLTELEQILDPKTFFRLNRSEIVNLNFIERLEPDFHDCHAVIFLYLAYFISEK